MKKLTFEEVKQSLAEFIERGYSIHDITTEEWREIILPTITYKIDNPIALIIRNGGKTHRVVDKDGLVHCYATPDSGKSVLRWKNKTEVSLIKF